MITICLDSPTIRRMMRVEVENQSAYYVTYEGTITMSTLLALYEEQTGYNLGNIANYHLRCIDSQWKLRNLERDSIVYKSWMKVIIRRR